VRLLQRIQARKASVAETDVVEQPVDQHVSTEQLKRQFEERLASRARRRGKPKTIK